MRKKGFTLIELLVVIAVISLLMGILLPALAKARQQSRSVICLSNLRQMAIAAQTYTEIFDGYYPIAQYARMTPGRNFLYSWDFTIIAEPGKRSSSPGLLWRHQMIEEIQQCPAFKGASNTLMDPYTGYNYNTSYIGHGEGENIPTPAKVVMVKNPGKCALFGDGQWRSGANKYMRAPWPNPGDATFTGRGAGTQGYRHSAKTNVAWCDGHSSSQKELYTETLAEEKVKIERYNAGAKNKVGFLSPDNSVYDLE